MLSFKPSGFMLHGIILHLKPSQTMASLDKEWLQAVEASTKDLRSMFLNSAFDVLCLERAPIFCESTIEQQLQLSIRIKLETMT